MQLIFVVESNKECKSDSKYISSLIAEFYEANGDKISYVYMDGKGNYDKKSSDIDRLVSKYGKNKVSNIIICIDVDYSANASTQHGNMILNNNIVNYCKKKSYDLIEFYMDIEDVFLGKKISDSDKKKFSDQFVSRGDISKVNIKDLQIHTISHIRHQSNIMCILDKYLTRK